jgi:hypothetical protein
MSKNKAQIALGQSGRKGKTQKSHLRPKNEDFLKQNRPSLKIKNLPSSLTICGAVKVEKKALIRSK